MTKQQKLRRNSYSADFNAGDDDFILAELDLMRDDHELPPVPLAHFMDDDEIIDSLLTTSDFNVDFEPEKNAGESDARALNDINLTDDFPGFDYVVESLALPKYRDSNSHVRADFDDIPDEDAIDRLLINTGFDANGEPESDTRLIDQLSPVDGVSGFDRFVVEPFEFVEPTAQLLPEIDENPALDSRIRADFDDRPVAKDNGFDGPNEPEDAARQDTRPVDAFAVTTADAASINPAKSSLALEKPERMVAKTAPEVDLNDFQAPTKDESFPLGSEQDAIKKLINDCEIKVKKAAVISYASLGFGLVALLAMIVMGIMFFRAQTKISKLSDLVTILEEDMGGIAGKNTDLLIDNSASSVERLNHTVKGLAESTEPVRSAAATGNKKIAVDVTKQVTVKKASVANLSPKPSSSSADVAKKKLTAPTRVHKTNSKLPSKAAPEKKKPVKKLSAVMRPATWSVNLAAYKDLSSAKMKAAKVLQKGVPVKVIAAAKNSIIGYRLQVGGFKNKAEAIMYSAKIKKSLNLNSVAVAPK